MKTSPTFARVLSFGNIELLDCTIVELPRYVALVDSRKRKSTPTLEKTKTFQFSIGFSDFCEGDLPCIVANWRGRLW